MKTITRSIVLALLCMLAVPEAFSQSWQYGTPFDTNAPATVFSQVACSVPRSYLLDSLKYPYPTTSWFKCLFLSKYDAVHHVYPDSMAGWSPVFTYPYAVGLGTIPVPGYVSYAGAHNRLGTGYRPYAVSITTSGVPGTNSVTFSSAFDWYFGVADAQLTPDVTEMKPFIKAYDDFSVTLKYRLASGGSGYMESPIVKGMPYVTMKYSGLIPFFASQARTLAAYSLDGTNFITLPNPNPVTVKSNRFILKMNGDGGPDKFIYWVLYASDSVEAKIYFGYMNSHIGSPYQGALFFTAPFTGYLRAAYLAANIAAVNNMPAYDDTQNMTGKLQVLNKYSRFYPTGGTFSAVKSNTSDVCRITFQWATNMPSNDSLLMFALPHHLDILSGSAAKDTILTQYQVIKGPLRGIKGKTWIMDENLVKSSWISDQHNLTGNTLDKYRDQLFKTLKGDRDTIAGATAFGAAYLNQINPSTYFGGKELAKKGRLAVIGDELSAWYPSAPVSKSIRDTLKANLNRWLEGKPLVTLPGWAQNGFRYDTVYGGMVNSLDQANVGADFGNSVYTDHHFHYGYFLYAAAALAKMDTAWAQANRSKILLLARDIANPSKQDKYFVKERNKDWFDGHCWAQGLSDAAGVGNNQESTSESVNAWYGLMLLGKALGDQNLENTGRLYLTTEIRSAQKYWQIGPDSYYPSGYTNLYKVVGNLYETSINSLVAFGDPGDPKMVYGIQQIPTTPVNYDLLYEPWCDSVYNFYSKDAPMFKSGSPTDIELQWATINLASYALSKPGNGYAYYRKNLANYKYFSDGNTRNILNFDDGESKTNVLYNTLVSAASNTTDLKLVLDVNITVLRQDTAGNCQGEVLVEVLNADQADPPFHYFWLFDDQEEEFYTQDAIVDSLCPGRHYLEVIDGEFNIGYAQVTIEDMTSLKENQLSSKIFVYPNPSAGTFTVKWGKNGTTPTGFIVTNSQGSHLFSQPVTSSGTAGQVVNLDGYPAGIYTLMATFDTGETVPLKLIKIQP